jgi:hypothetical protein
MWHAESAATNDCSGSTPGATERSRRNVRGRGAHGHPNAMVERERMAAVVGLVLELGGLEPPIDRRAMLRHGYILKIPNLVSSIGALSEAEIARPRSLRMSAGSTTPSSHKRALA